MADQLRSAFVIERRAPEQDLDFCVRRIVDIALRALSPGINNPTTTLYCIDRLGEAFGVFAQRETPSPWRVDDEGKLRVLAEMTDPVKLALSAFSAVARYGRDDRDVRRKLRDTLSTLLVLAPPMYTSGLVELREKLDAVDEGLLGQAT